MDKLEETINNLQTAIDKIKNNESKFIFLSPDTKGSAKASVSYIYKQALALKKNGYNVSILHEKNDYIRPDSWLGEGFADLIHESIEDNKLVVGPQDFIIIPEFYANIFEQTQQLPVEKIILVQSYDHLLDSFSPGKSWLDFDVFECITTSKITADLIEDISGMQNISFVNPCFSDSFCKPDKPQMPVIGIHCREPRKAAKIIKTFYLKYPLYRFVSFKDMHGITEIDFPRNIKECAVSVWVDDESTFGTYPIESIKCNVPVIGKVPNIMPEWMDDDNGVWVYDENQIPDLVFGFIKNWMEDNLPDNLKNVHEKMDGKYSVESFEKATVEVYQTIKDRKTDKLTKIKENMSKTIEKNEE